VRGNFRTAEWVVRDELDFRRGELLTGDLFTTGPRRLRATNLFDAVKLDFVGMDDPRRDSVDVVVRVEERDDQLFRVDVEVGANAQVDDNWLPGVFVRGKPVVPNLLGWGVRAEISGTKAWGNRYSAIETNLRLPRWLPRHVTPLSFDTDVTAFYRKESTDRFGDLETYGGAAAFSKTWERPRTDDHGGRLFTAALRYDFRRRQRDEVLLRPPGVGGDLETNPIITRTGTFGVSLRWDQRRDDKGNLNPLAPDTGFRLEGGVNYARPEFGGQDTFVKLNALGQAFASSGRFLLRVDARYDHGIPLGGAVLLPEVERFFAGGDSTVRGFEEDRLMTEIVEVPVPPLGQTTQIEIRPAGGNIRALSTVDGQVKLWRLYGFDVASAVFTDAGLVTNTWKAVELSDIRPSVGMAGRLLLPIGAISLEYAIPLFPELGDNPRGRFHFAIALRY
jgi:outer membrane protein assembly factor BamA